jgi:hypothetical protein
MVSKLEDLDLESDPLGPLGESAPEVVAPPPPPAKDDSPAPRVTRQPPTTFAEIKSDIAEPIKRVDSLAQAPPSMSRQLSIPLEQAAQPPTFKITVGDPTIIGNITGSHTEYKVRTKVLLLENVVDSRQIRRLSRMKSSLSIDVIVTLYGYTLLLIIIILASSFHLHLRNNN